MILIVHVYMYNKTDSPKQDYLFFNDRYGPISDVWSTAAHIWVKTKQITVLLLIHQEENLAVEQHFPDAGFSLSSDK